MTPISGRFERAVGGFSLAGADRHTARHRAALRSGHGNSLLPTRQNRFAGSVRCKTDATHWRCCTGWGQRSAGSALAARCWAWSQVQARRARCRCSQVKPSQIFLGAQRQFKSGAFSAGLQMAVAQQAHQPHRNHQAVAADFRNQAQARIDAQAQQLKGAP